MLKLLKSVIEAIHSAIALILFIPLLVVAILFILLDKLSKGMLSFIVGVICK